MDGGLAVVGAGEVQAVAESQQLGRLAPGGDLEARHGQGGGGGGSSSRGAQGGKAM